MERIKKVLERAQRIELIEQERVGYDANTEQKDLQNINLEFIFFSSINLKNLFFYKLVFLILQTYL